MREEQKSSDLDKMKNLIETYTDLQQYPVLLPYEIENILDAENITEDDFDDK